MTPDEPRTENDALIEQVTLACRPTVLADGRLATLIVPDGGSVEEIDLTPYLPDAPRPQRATGTSQLDDEKSFVGWVLRHRRAGTTIWCAERNGVSVQMTAVINDSLPSEDDAGEAGTGWRDFHGLWPMRSGDSWAAWHAVDRKWIGQHAFAELLEERAIDVEDATMWLEIAESIQAHTDIVFSSGIRLTNGQRQFTYNEVVNGSAGASGQLTIPETMTLNLQVIDGGDLYRQAARFRYRIADGKLAVMVLLERPRDTLLTALFQIRQRVEAAVDIPIFSGTI